MFCLPLYMNDMGCCKVLYVICDTFCISELEIWTHVIQEQVVKHY